MRSTTLSSAITLTSYSSAQVLLKRHDRNAGAAANAIASLKAAEGRPRDRIDILSVWKRSYFGVNKRTQKFVTLLTTFVPKPHFSAGRVQLVLTVMLTIFMLTSA
jgi:hypothetical protein